MVSFVTSHKNFSNSKAMKDGNMAFNTFFIALQMIKISNGILSFGLPLDPWTVLLILRWSLYIPGFQYLKELCKKWINSIFPLHFGPYISLSHFRICCSNRSDGIHVLWLALYGTGRFLTFLKHYGFWGLLINKSLFFSDPSRLAHTRVVIEFSPEPSSF